MSEKQSTDVQSYGKSGTSVRDLAALADSRALSLLTLAGVMYVYIYGLPRIPVESRVIAYIKFAILGSIFAGIPLIQLGSWVREQLVTDTRDKLYELDESGVDMGGIHIDLTEVEIEVDEGSLGVREPVSAVGGYKNDIYICREVKEVVERDNKAKDAIIVDGVIDWDDVDVPQPDQILANRTQIAQYQKNVEKEARKGYKIRNSLLALREKMKADLVQQLALRYETATDSVTDIENMLGDAVDEYETFDNENEEELEQLLEELEEERENAGEAENPDPDAGGGEE